MRWCPDGDFWRFFGSCMSSEQRTAHFRWLRLGEESKKKERTIKCPHLLRRAAITRATQRYAYVYCIGIRYGHRDVRKTVTVIYICRAINCLSSGINILAGGSSIPLISERKGTDPPTGRACVTHTSPHSAAAAH